METYALVNFLLVVDDGVIEDLDSSGIGSAKPIRFLSTSNIVQY